MRNWQEWKNASRRLKLISNPNIRWFILLPLILLIGCGGKEPEIKTSRIVIDELICDDGVRIFEGRVLALQGIKSVSVNMSNQQAEISFQSDKVDEETIFSHLLEFGFTVNGTAGNEAARKRLPSCCFEKVEEGLE